MKRNLLISLVLIGILAFGLGVGSYAYFTSQAKSENNTFATGTLVIDSPGSLTKNMTVDNIYPGWYSDIKTIKVHNSGTLDLKCRMSVLPNAGNPLYDGDTPLEVAAYWIPFVNGSESEEKTDQASLLPMYKKINAMGYVDLGGFIPSGKDGTLIVGFRLPEAANNAYQGIKGDFTFVFDATQVKNQGWTEAVK